MLYVCLLSYKPTASSEERDAAMSRRAQWNYPQGARMVAEYWLGTNTPAVIAVFEAESFGPIMEIDMDWGDIFDIEVFPATTFEEGLKMGGAIMQRRGQG